MTEGPRLSWPEAAEDPRRAREEARLELEAEADLGPGRESPLQQHYGADYVSEGAPIMLSTLV